MDMYRYIFACTMLVLDLFHEILFGKGKNGMCTLLLRFQIAKRIRQTRQRQNHRFKVSCMTGIGLSYLAQRRDGWISYLGCIGRYRIMRNLRFGGMKQCVLQSGR